MKRIGVLLLLTIMMVGCSGNTKGIEHGMFMFDVGDIEERYEELNDRLITVDMNMRVDSIDVDKATREDVINILHIVNEYIEDDKMNKVINTFKQDGEVSTITDKVNIFVFERGSGYEMSIFVNDEDDDE